jgi:hypothetical protein
MSKTHDKSGRGRDIIEEGRENKTGVDLGEEFAGLPNYFIRLVNRSNRTKIIIFLQYLMFL